LASTGGACAGDEQQEVVAEQAVHPQRQRGGGNAPQRGFARTSGQAGTLPMTSAMPVSKNGGTWRSATPSEASGPQRDGAQGIQVGLGGGLHGRHCTAALHRRETTVGVAMVAMVVSRVWIRGACAAVSAEGER
jgi:hypothetical protein